MSEQVESSSGGDGYSRAELIDHLIHDCTDVFGLDGGASLTALNDCSDELLLMLHRFARRKMHVGDIPASTREARITLRVFYSLVAGENRRTLMDLIVFMPKLMLERGVHSVSEAESLVHTLPLYGSLSDRDLYSVDAQAALLQFVAHARTNYWHGESPLVKAVGTRFDSTVISDERIAELILEHPDRVESFIGFAEERNYIDYETMKSLSGVSLPLMVGSL